MMKKFYLLFALLLSFLGVTQVVAQDEIQIPINANSGDYTLWNNNPNSPWARGWASTSENPQVTISCGANNFAPWNGTDFQFFNCVGGSGTSYEYTFAVSAGWEFVSISLDFKASHADKSVYVSVENEQSEVNESTTDFIHYEYGFAPETTTFGFIVGATESSKFAKTQNFVVIVQKMEELSVAIAELFDVVNKYSPYTTEGETPFIGDGKPGNYDAEAVAAFNETITRCSDEDNWEDPESATYIKGLTEQIEAAYQAVVASRVTNMPLPDGYYQLRTGINYADGQTKYAYVVPNSNGTINGKWGSLTESVDPCQSLFKFTNIADGTVDILSVATDARFNDNPGTLSVKSENTWRIEPAVTIEDQTYVNILLNGKETASYYYIHQGSHNSGAGTGGNLTSWCPSYPAATENKMGGSEWILEYVDDEAAAEIIAAYQPTKERNQLIVNFKNIFTEAKEAMADAKDIQEYTDLITDGNEQFSSPWTETREGIGKSGNWNELLDGKNDTYWHSDWSNSVPNHTHYLQVELNEPVYDLIQMKITRRPVSNDHITLWGVWGTNTPDEPDVLWEEGDELPDGVNVGDVKETAWVELASLATPYGNSNETKISDEFNTQGFKFLRFYIDGTTTGRGYGHVSEFQLSIPKPNPKAQYAFIGEPAVALDNLLREYNAAIKSDDDITAERYEALVAAYDVFKAMYVGPAELRELLASVEDIVDGVVVGTAPGYWPDTSTGDALKATYDEAKAYDAAGIYDAAKSKQYIETLKAQAQAVQDAAIKIQEGKWYRFRFASEELFDANEWNKVAGQATVQKEIQTDEALWGKFITVATLNSSWYKIEENDSVKINEVVPIDEAEDVSMGASLFLDAAEDVEVGDLSLFRFVNVGDTAYVIQNKATGMFIKAAGSTGATTLSIQPSLFSVSAVGYGENVMAATNLITDAKQNYLHGQKSENRVVTWNAYTAGSASGFFIDEVADVASSYDGTEFRMNLKPGSVNSFCYPVNIKAAENYELYDVVGVEDGTIKLNPITEVNAGRPFIFICDGDYVKDADDKEPYSFLHGYEFTKEAIAGPLLKGTYNTIASLPKGAITNQGDGFVISKSATMSMIPVPANTAYIQADEEFPLMDYTYEILIEPIPDGVNKVLQKVAATGELYTTDGRLISRNANLNDLKRFGKGLYILNGVKVVVK